MDLPVDVDKIVYGVHERRSLEYYNYYGMRITEAYREYLYRANPDSDEYVFVGFIYRAIQH